MLEKVTMWKKNKFKETPAVLELFNKVGIEGFSRLIDGIHAAHHVQLPIEIEQNNGRSCEYGGPPECHR
jgi:hypothetical protein